MLNIKSCKVCGSSFIKPYKYSCKQWESKTCCSSFCGLKSIGKEPGKTFEDRFFSKFIQKDSDHCWEWFGSSDNKGYGRLNVDGKPMLAHRFSYLWHRGFLPKNRLIMHSCDNPKCVNPNHLNMGTNMDNNQDMINKNRSWWLNGKGRKPRAAILCKN